MMYQLYCYNFEQELILVIIIIMDVYQLSEACSFSYAAIRNIVVMLSVADMILAVSHIWGTSQNFEKFIEAYHPIGTNISSTDTQCTAQAVLAVFGTLSSFLWTLALVSFVFVMYLTEGN